MATSLRKEKTELEKAMRNHSNIFPKNSWQFAHIKEKKAVESHDCLHPESTWYLTKGIKTEIPPYCALQSFQM